MRYRAQSDTGDYVFLGNSPFYINTPETVAQAVLTRLRLTAGEWFIDDRVGFDLNLVLGNNTQNSRDLEVQRVILGTQGVTSLVSYTSEVSPDRRFTVTAVVDTLYGPVTITETF